MMGAVVFDVAAGSAHACFLRNQYVFCWGRNVDGELGIGTFSPMETKMVPAKI